MPNDSKGSEKQIAINKISTWLSDDRKILSISYGGVSDFTVNLKTKQVDDMLAAVGKWRERMEPNHATSYAPVKHVTAIKNPAFYSEPELSMGGSLLHLRHPAFGWLHFWLPKDEAAKLHGYLEAQAKEQSEPS